MEIEEITKALQENDELLTGVTSHILETEKGKEIIDNKANVIYKEKIGNEVSEIHKKYDEDMFNILGEKPGTLDDGNKQKTYDKIKDIYSELAELRKKKDSLSKDAKVVELQNQIEELKKNGGGAHWEQTFNTEKEKWLNEKQELEQRVQESQSSIVNFQKRTDIESGLRSLKFDDNIPEGARKAFVDNVVSGMIKNSKIEDGKIIYLDENGGQINNSEYKPMSASEILKTELKDILKNENTDGGGGASKTVKGSIEKSNVDGKDVEKLILSDSSFKTKSEFLNVAEKAMLDSGITKRDKRWDILKNEAYKRYNVSKLPR